MSKFQLYIGNQRVEMYDDEPVNLIETIQTCFIYTCLNSKSRNNLLIVVFTISFLYSHL